MDDLPIRLITAVSILLIGGYFIGVTRNRRVGRALAWWVHAGLRDLGAETTIRWLGASGFLIGARGLPPPLTRLTVTALLEPREVAPLWLYAHLRGRRDVLVVRFALARPPQGSIEIVQPASFIGRAALAAIAEDHAWAARRRDGFVIATRGGHAAVADELWGIFRQHTAGLWQVSVRPVDPHLQVSLSPGASSEARVTWSRLLEATRLMGGAGS